MKKIMKWGFRYCKRKYIKEIVEKNNFKIEKEKEGINI